MKTSFELEHLAREADCQGNETRADHLYAAANEAREAEDDAIMSIPAHERYLAYQRWCGYQRRIYHETST